MSQEGERDHCRDTAAFPSQEVIMELGTCQSWPSGTTGVHHASQLEPVAQSGPHLLPVVPKKPSALSQLPVTGRCSWAPRDPRGIVLAYRLGHAGTPPILPWPHTACSMTCGLSHRAMWPQ